MSVVVTFVLGLAGFLALALAMQRHQRDLLGRTLSSSANRVWSLAGWVLLLAGAMLMLVQWGAVAGLALWCTILSGAGIGVVTVITWRTQRTSTGRAKLRG